MNSTWYKVTGNQAPEAWDLTSSPTTVYQNKDIAEATGVDMDGNEYTYYTWMQRKYTREEYNQLHNITTQTIMQALSDLEVSIAEMGGMV